MVCPFFVLVSGLVTGSAANLPGRFQGGSIPPLPNGLHRTIRQKLLQLPHTSPYFFNAWMV